MCILRRLGIWAPCQSPKLLRHGGVFRSIKWGWLGEASWATDQNGDLIGFEETLWISPGKNREVYPMKKKRKQMQATTKGRNSSQECEYSHVSFGEIVAVPARWFLDLGIVAILMFKHTWLILSMFWSGITLRYFSWRRSCFPTTHPELILAWYGCVKVPSIVSWPNLQIKDGQM